MRHTRLKKTKFSASSLLMLLLFLAMAILTLLPFYSIFLASLRPGNEIMRQGIGLEIDPSIMSMQNYRHLFSAETPYFTWFTNSIIITVVQLVRGVRVCDVRLQV